MRRAFTCRHPVPRRLRGWYGASRSCASATRKGGGARRWPDGGGRVLPGPCVCPQRFPCEPPALMPAQGQASLCRAGFLPGEVPAAACPATALLPETFSVKAGMGMFCRLRNCSARLTGKCFKAYRIMLQGLWENILRLERLFPGGICRANRRRKHWAGRLPAVRRHTDTETR